MRPRGITLCWAAPPRKPCSSDCSRAGVRDTLNSRPHTDPPHTPRQGQIDKRVRDLYAFHLLFPCTWFAVANSYWQGLDSVCAPFVTLLSTQEALAFACFEQFVSAHLAHLMVYGRQLDLKSKSYDVSRSAALRACLSASCRSARQAADDLHASCAIWWNWLLYRFWTTHTRCNSPIHLWLSSVCVCVCMCVLCSPVAWSQASPAACV